MKLAPAILGLFLSPALGAVIISQIYPVHQALAREAASNTFHGSTERGQVSYSPGGLGVTTLVGFQMPSVDYTGYRCNLTFPTQGVRATGSSTFHLFQFIPDHGEVFDAGAVSWNHRSGYRDTHLTTYTVEQGSNIIYSMFGCPSPGKGVNFELVPAMGDVSITWDSKVQGLTIEVV